MMAMRKPPHAATKVRSAWRCPKCGAKIITRKCYGCYIEAKRDKTRNGKPAG